MHCPLCCDHDARAFHQDQQRPYLRCGRCQLVFVPPAYFLSAAAEKAEYDLHENSPENASYRRFLARLFNPMQSLLAPGSQGLDFGSGPGPTLSVMFEERGHAVALYDPFYAHNPACFEGAYDFITATEVLEHLHQPQQELQRIWGCLKPGGILGIMTKLVIDQAAFTHWHYKNDRTHVCFFSQPTFEWLAHQWQATLTFAAKDVIFLQKDLVQQDLRG